jgi:hypothetical protein
VRVSKLFKLKKWMPLQEAASYLSGALAEPITEADLLRLGLDGHLKLSIYLLRSVGAYVGKLIPIDEVRGVLPRFRGQLS